MHGTRDWMMITLSLCRYHHELAEKGLISKQIKNIICESTPGFWIKNIEMTVHRLPPFIQKNSLNENFQGGEEIGQAVKKCQNNE